MIRFVDGWATIDQGPNHDLLSAGAAVFVMRLHHVPGAADIRRALAAIDDNINPLDPHAIVWVVTPEVSGYDSSLLEIYRTDGKKPRMPSFMSVVARNPFHRMVVRAVAVGFQMAMRTPLVLYDDEETAVRAARNRLLAS